MSPLSKKTYTGRELDAISKDEDIDLDPPPNGEPYRYSCPVDHAGHMVNMRGWRCTDRSNQSAVILVHDVAEDIKMYRSSAKFICQQGYSCYGFDQRGHGESTDRLGHISDFQDLVRDLLQVTAWVRHMHKGQLPVLVGQGYGCLVACEMVAKHPGTVSAIILSAPTVELTRKPSRVQRLAIKLFADLAPDLRLPKLIRPRFSNPLHRDYSDAITTRIVESLISGDDLRVTASFARELLAAMDRFGDTFKQLSVPVLVLRPEADEVARFDCMNQVIQSHPNPASIHMKSIPGVHHNPFTDDFESMSLLTTETLNWLKNLPTVTSHKNEGAS